MADSEQDKPKIIVDDDWKTQAQAEKQKLAEEVEKKADSAQAAAAGAGAAGEEGQQNDRQIPPPSFSVLVTSIATQALMGLGGMVDRESGKRMVDPELAKHHIDTLAVLEEKTKGNLTDEEKALLDQALYQCRMQYVQVMNHLSQLGQ